MPESDLLILAGAAVEAAKTAGAAEAWAGTSRSRSVDFQVRDGILEKVSEATSQSLSLQVWVDGRYSSTSSTDLRPDEIARLAKEAVALTRALQPDPFRKIPDSSLFEGRAEVDLDLVDDSVRALTRDEREALCRAQNEVLAGKVKVISATSTSSDGQSVSAMASSNGFSGTQESTWLWIGSEVTLQDDTSRPEGWMFAGGPHREQVPSAEVVAAEAMKRARDRLGSTKGPTRKSVMVVDPTATARLLSRLVGPASAGSVQQGRSFWADRLGKQVLSKKLTITDEPLLVRGLASRLFDGEGISSKPMPLVSAGVLSNLYVDTYYGLKLDKAPTTGSRSNVVVAPGKRDLAAILADLYDGIYVTSWLGGNADTTTGDFSFGMRGHVVKNGAIGSPVGEMNVTGNLVDLFAALSEVGNDPWPYSSMLVPTLVFDGVDFSGA